MEENNANIVKRVVAHDKDGNPIYPITHADAINVTGSDSSLGKILEDNKKVMDEIYENMDDIADIKEELDEKMDDLLYAYDGLEDIELEIDKIIIEDETELEGIDVDTIINYGDKLTQLIKYIKLIERKSVGHQPTKEDIEEYDRVSLITTRQEISDLKAEIASLKSEIISMNNTVTSFVGSDIYAIIKDNLMDSVKSEYIDDINDGLTSIRSNLSDLNVRTSALEARSDKIEEDINNIYKIFGVTNIDELPEAKSVGDLLDALYDITHEFIEWKNDESGE